MRTIARPAGQPQELYYQPVVDPIRREVIGVEALARPGAFPPPALLDGQGSGGGVLETACTQGARWSQQGLRLEVAVSLSVQQASDVRVLESLERILAETRFEPGLLLLQISERSLADETRDGPPLARLAALGVRLGLDGFGTGHSSLVHLKRYPITTLKIDATFVRGLGSDRNDEAIVASVAALAASLDIRCIAGGVEHARQHTTLLWLRAQAQGDFYAAAAPAAEIPAAVDRAEAVMDTAQPSAARTRVPRPAPDLPAAVAEQMVRLHRDGASLQTIAAALNQANAVHPRGRRWHASSVATYLPRCAGTPGLPLSLDEALPDD